MPSIPVSVLAIVGLIPTEVVPVLGHKPLIRSTEEIQPDGSFVQKTGVRKEQGHRVMMNAAGDMRLEPEANQDSDSPSEPTNACDEDFTFGKPNSNECIDSDAEALIMSKNDCMWAAANAKFDDKGREDLATTSVAMDKDVHHFNLPSLKPGTGENGVAAVEWQHYAPKGCFRAKCRDANGEPLTGADAGKLCMFYNDGLFETTPADPLGQFCRDAQCRPLCKRANYLNGTAHVKGEAVAKAHGACPTSGGYGPVMDGTKCAAIAGCLGRSTGDQCAGEFRITARNMSEYNFYPLGCFIHHDNGCVFFNPRITNTATNQPYPEPTNPQLNGGTEICQVGLDRGADTAVLGAGGAASDANGAGE